MKMKLTILPLFFSLLTFGQSGKTIRQSEDIFKLNPELKLLDSLLITDIVGCYTFNLDGMLVSTYYFDSTSHFRVKSFAEFGSTADTDTWQILKKNILQFKSFKRLHSYYIIKFDRFHILVQAKKEKQFVSYFNKVRLRIEERQKSNPVEEQKSKNDLIVEVLIRKYQIRDILKTCT